jgi:DNA-binding NtrC family response regulator
VFLDEIGNMPAPQQAKLLRVLQTGEFHRVGSSKTRTADVRVLSATNIDIEREVSEGRFREDLLYRLNTVEIHLPPLRDRREDILPLAMHFLAHTAARYGKDAAELDAGARRALHEHAWPGNVRELEHAVERAVLMAQGAVIVEDDLGLRRRTDSATLRLEAMTLDDAERYLIERALERHGGNVSDAADELGLSRSALYRRLQRYGLGGEE